MVQVALVNAVEGGKVQLSRGVNSSVDQQRSGGLLQHRCWVFILWLPEGDDQVTGPPDLKANSHRDVVSIHDSHGEQTEIVFEKRLLTSMHT